MSKKCQKFRQILFCKYLLLNVVNPILLLCKLSIYFVMAKYVSKTPRKNEKNKCFYLLQNL